MGKYKSKSEEYVLLNEDFVTRRDNQTFIIDKTFKVELVDDMIDLRDLQSNDLIASKQISLKDVEKEMISYVNRVSEAYRNKYLS